MTKILSKITTAGLLLGLDLQAGYGMEIGEDPMISVACPIMGINPSREGVIITQKFETPKDFALRNPISFVSSRLRFGDWLRLDYINLGDNEIAAIAPHLNQVAFQTKTLDLEYNHITAQGIKALLPFLPEFINLEWLILCDNSIGDEGLEILGPYIAQLPKLKTLILGNINITHSAIISLIPHLPAHISLGSVGSFLKDEGEEALREAGFCARGNDWVSPVPARTQERRNSGQVFIITPPSSKIRF